MQEKVFNNGDVMIRQGENDPFFYQIISGSADVFVTDDAEKQIDITNTGTAAIVVRVTFFGPDKMEVVPDEAFQL